MTLVKALAFAAVVYGGVVAFMYVAQRGMMYFPETLRTAPAVAGLPEAEEVILDTADGEKVIAWHAPPRDGRPLILYFHGNGGALQHRVPRFRPLVDDGNGLLALSYRGYGGSTGEPSEAGLIADAVAAYALARRRYPTAPIVLWGESLGTGVAVALAAREPAAAVILEAPFTSAVDIGAATYWFLPVRLLMKDQFRSDSRIADIKAPLLVMHGARDGVVPIAYGERLFALAREPKRFVRFPGGDHNDLDAYGAVKEVKKFFGALGLVRG